MQDQVLIAHWRRNSRRLNDTINKRYAAIENHRYCYQESKLQFHMSAARVTSPFDRPKSLRCQAGGPD